MTTIRINFTHRWEVPIEVSLLIAIAAGENAIHLCREGAVPVITIGDVNPSGGHTPHPRYHHFTHLQRNHRRHNRRLKPALSKYTASNH